MSPVSRPCTPSDLMGDFTVFQGNLDIAQFTSAKFINNDPSRICLILSAQSGGINYYISLTDNSVDPGDSILIPASIAPVTFTFRDHPGFVQHEMYASPLGNNLDLSWIEIYYRPAALNQ